MTVRTALADIVRNPLAFLRARWNWKAATASALMRGPIFFASTLEFGLSAAARALIVDAAFRLPVAGTCAALIQSVRDAQPRWAAIAIAVIAVPAGAHLIEIAAHAAAGTPLLWRGVVLSSGLSAVSSAAEWTLMRHEILLVGPGAGSLVDDCIRLLRLGRRVTR